MKKWLNLLLSALLVLTLTACGTGTADTGASADSSGTSQASSDISQERIMLGLRLTEGIPLSWLDDVQRKTAEPFVKAGLTISGINDDKNLVEIIELKDHPFFVACQFHPEFKSRPYKPHPLFVGFVNQAIGNIKKSRLN